MLLARILTASVLAPLLIAALWSAPPVAFFSLVFLASVLASWEWLGLTGFKKVIETATVCAVFAALLLLSLLLPVYLILLLSSLGALLWLGLAYFVIRQAPWPRWWQEGRTGRLLLGCTLLLTFWLSIHLLYIAKPLLLFVFLLVVITDTGAYFAGKRWGKHCLAPSISPGKTWEGVFGGLFAASVLTGVAVFGFHLLGKTPSWLLVLLFSLVSLASALFSVIGDLFESRVKRYANSKDSGRCLPGHGGMLDRIDGMLAAMPIFTLGVLHLGLLR